jgi:hypothetical protein
VVGEGLGLDDFPGLDATGANVDPLVCSVDLGADGSQIDIPAALGHVVSVRDLVAELRTLTAHLADLSHDKLHLQ